MITITNDAPTTTSALEGDGYTTSDFRTEDQWLGEAAEHRGKKRELVRLAYVNKFGFTQGKLAKLLGCDKSTVRGHVDNLLATGELTEEHYQKKMCNSRKPEQTGGKTPEPVENSTPKSTTPLSTNTNDQQQVRLLQSPDDSCPVVEPEVLTDLQMGGPEVDIRSFTPVLEQLLFGIEAARRNSANTAEEWGSLSAMLQTLYHHAQCESKQRRLRREREAAE
jgi:hypothetical protein